jgi:DNA-binding MarR family transcriptional regulator
MRGIVLPQQFTKPLSDLATALGITAATTSDAVKALSEKGLVSKTRDPENARALAITLTKTGLTQAHRAADWPDFLLDAVDTLSGTEQTVMLRAMQKILRTLQERDQIPVSSMCITCAFFQANVHTQPAPLRLFGHTVRRSGLAVRVQRPSGCTVRSGRAKLVGFP